VSGQEQVGLRVIPRKRDHQGTVGGDHCTPDFGPSRCLAVGQSKEALPRDFDVDLFGNFNGVVDLDAG
jgi:hypothetical protein